MKKIIRLNLIVLVALILVSLCGLKSVYAESSCDAILQIEKSEYTKDDEISVYVRIINIKSDFGILAGNMTLVYDQDSLELLNMYGQNDWDTPIPNVTYNKANGKIVTTKNGFAKNDENILKIVFKAINNKDNVKIGLNNISFADSNLIRLTNSPEVTIKIKEPEVVPTEPVEVEPSTPEVTIPEPTETETNITEQSETTTSKPEQNNIINTTINNIIESEQNEADVKEDENTQSTIYPVLTSGENNTTNSNESKNDDSVSKSKLPQTGEKRIILIVSIFIFIICMIFIIRSCVKYMKNKNIDNNDEEDE